MSKKSIRFFNDREVRAVWDEEHSKRWYSATDIVCAINDEEDYKKCRNYWKYLKGKWPRTALNWLVSLTTSNSKLLMANSVLPENTFDEIVNKYVEMNVAHPFMEGNGRSTRIWLDLIFKKRLKLCVDWSKIDKNSYLDAMRQSVTNATPIKALLQGAMTDRIDDREIFMKGIDYSYYYEQDE